MNQDFYRFALLCLCLGCAQATQAEQRDATVNAVDSSSAADANVDHADSSTARDAGLDATVLPHTLPSITSFAASPSDTFIVSADALSLLSMATPFSGSAASCAHQGAHVQFQAMSEPYAIDVFAAADGRVSRVDTCFDIGLNDRYGISITVAKSDGADVDFDYSLEPMGGHLCGKDPHFYERFLFVEEGDWVHKGDKIAELYHPVKADGATHIHFHLRINGREGFYCPNIFTKEIEQAFYDNRNGFDCGGGGWSPGFCWLLDPGQDLVHGK